MRNGDLRLLSAGITRNIHLDAENGVLREFVEQLQFRVGELQLGRVLDRLQRDEDEASPSNSSMILSHIGRRSD